VEVRLKCADYLEHRRNHFARGSEFLERTSDSPNHRQNEETRHRIQGTVTLKKLRDKQHEQSLADALQFSQCRKAALVLIGVNDKSLEIIGIRT